MLWTIDNRQPYPNNIGVYLHKCKHHKYIPQVLLNDTYGFYFYNFRCYSENLVLIQFHKTQVGFITYNLITLKH